MQRRIFSHRPFTLLASAVLALACGEKASTGDTSSASNGAMPPATGAEGPQAPTGGQQPAAPLGQAPIGLPMQPAGAGGEILADGQEPVITPVALTEDRACASQTLTPEEIEVEMETEITTTTDVLQPVAMYIVLDNSRSMNDNLPGFENDDGFNGGNFGGGGDDDMGFGAAGMPAQQLQAPGDAGLPAQPEPAPTTDPPETRWELAVQSLQEFVSAPGSEGLDVAIQYFNSPMQQESLAMEDSPQCDGTFHSQPDVAMGRLPETAQALIESLDDAQPTGYTPTVGALRGGIQYCEAFELSNPDENCVVILVTDGLPRGCGLECGNDCFDPMSNDVLVPIAASGLAAGVATFTVGMDGLSTEGFGLLDAIAAAGGSDCTPPDPGMESCNVSASGSQGLVDALNAIRDTVTVTETVTEVTVVTETVALPCQWAVPQPMGDEMVDPDFINVTLSVDGSEAAIIESVADAAACAATGGVGWYYDNPDEPTVIHACELSCSTIENAVNPEIDILLGCATVPAGSR